MRHLYACLLAAALSSTNSSATDSDKQPVNIASKTFTESVILGEVLRLLAEDAGFTSTHRKELGATRVVWNALLRGDIHAYPEYSGTLLRELLANHKFATLEEAVEHMEQLGLRMTRPLGFNNTYVLGMDRGKASSLGIQKISDLRDHPSLRLGFSAPFMERADGWPGLKAHYRLPQKDARGMNHDLAYRGIESGGLDVTDLYSTDAEIAYYELATLKDDLEYFPSYLSVIVYRIELESRAPAFVQRIKRLEERIDETTMVRLNAAAKIDGRPEAMVAAEFLTKQFAIAPEVERESMVDRVLRTTLDHLELVGISLGAAILVALPLGVLAAKTARFGQIILGVVGIIQTIPSLALLVFMIPLLGIGGPPAMVALFLYSLLPIVRNTCTGLTDIPPSIQESSVVIGLGRFARLFRIELPLASRSIFAGIKTSAIINIGTATLGALIGAGGYGQPILTGIRRDDIGLILQGAIPAAILALLVQGLFELSERVIVPKGLRLKTSATH